MTCNEIIAAALQYAGKRSGQDLPMTTIVAALNTEARIIAAKHPEIIEEEITIGADGTFAMSSLTTGMVIVAMYDSNGDEIERAQ